LSIVALLQAENFLPFFVGYSYLLQYLSPADNSGLTKHIRDAEFIPWCQNPDLKHIPVNFKCCYGREFNNSKQLMKKCYGSSIIEDSEQYH
jgi:hypothetical protein